MIVKQSPVWLAATWILVLGLTSQVWAQTNEEAFEQFQWNVSTPSAKATAMGGAFVASADDATAVLLNPAGLITVGRQVAVEFRSIDQRVERLAAVDSLFTGALTTFRERLNAISFIAAVWPLRADRVAVALARHEFLHYKSSFHLSPRVIPGATGMARAHPAVDSEVDFEAVSYAASIAAAVHNRLRLGLTVSLNRLSAESLHTRRDFIAGASPFDLRETPVITNQSRIEDADTAVGVTVAALYQPIARASFGLVFHRRPSFKVTEEFELNTGRELGQVGPFVPQSGFPTMISLDPPDQLSAGAALRPHARVLVALDGTYIRYSDLARNLTPVVGHNFFLMSRDFTIDDAAAVHLGGEVNVGTDSRPVLLRAGVFTNPDHRLKFVGNIQAGGSVMPAQAQRINALERARFNLGEDETGVTGTFGGGLAIGPRLLADVAYVWKEQLMLSVKARF